MMKFASALSLRSRLEDALRECSAQVLERLGAEPDAAFLFLTPHFHKEYDSLPKLLFRFLRPGRLLGCSAGGVIGSGREEERHPAVALSAALFPGVRLTPFHLEPRDLPDMDAPPGAWAKALKIEDRSSRPGFLLLADPFSFNPEDLARGLDYAYPGSTAVGGLASGAQKPGHNALYLGERCLRSGAVGLALQGPVALDSIVAQGCRPVGRALQVTACEENLLLELDGQPALTALEELLDALPQEDQVLARTSLFLGLLNSPLTGKEARTGGGYLIRNLVGMEPGRGVLAVGALPRPGQLVRFHLRDKRSSAEELKKRLEEYARARAAGPEPAGALLFSCMGRGEQLYGVPNHDTGAFLRLVGEMPVGGFFCNGEIGPVEGATYLHGYTSCFGVFRPTA